LFAEAHGREGNFTDGLAALTEALTVAEETGIGMHQPEMHGLKGEFRLHLNPENSADAEDCFRQALAVAHRHQAKSLELRATMSLARLWQRQGRRTEGRAALDAAAQLNGLA
jgi:predicted ATPase